MKYPDDFINKLIVGNCLEVMEEIPDSSIDLVFTDPPYPKEYFHCYQYLVDECPRIMKSGASLVTIVPHYSLDDVVDYFNGKLKYRWILCMNQFIGTHPRMAMGIEVMWKPMLWYVKGSYPSGRGFLRDGIEITGKGGQHKKLHKWEQDISWCKYYIEKLTKEGDLVLDPFIGSGTTALACKELNRNYIGIDISEEYIRIAEERLNG
jgi:23S rRNA G2069 N7-methylase RlmK/C1962 C5-methylase RlmI